MDSLQMHLLGLDPGSDHHRIRNSKCTRVFAISIAVAIGIPEYSSSYACEDAKVAC